MHEQMLGQLTAENTSPESGPGEAPETSGDGSTVQ